MITTLQNVTPDGKKLIACKAEDLNKVLSDLPNGNYSVLGSCTHDTIDFDVTPHIGKLNLSGAGIVFQDYLRKQLFLPSSQDSFRSLLSASGLEFNNNNKYVILKEV